MKYRKRMEMMMADATIKIAFMILLAAISRAVWFAGLECCMIAYNSTMWIPATMERRSESRDSPAQIQMDKIIQRQLRIGYIENQFPSERPERSQQKNESRIAEIGTNVPWIWPRNNLLHSMEPIPTPTLKQNRVTISGFSHWIHL